MESAEYLALAAVEDQHWWCRHLHHRVLTVLRDEAQRRGRRLQVFDAGCGSGGLLQRLRGDPWLAAAVGCDLHPLALELAGGRGLTVRRWSVHDLASWPQRYDSVLSLDVLYHRQVDPPRALAGMAGLLNPEGLLVLNVAAMPCLARRHDERTMGSRRFQPAQLHHLAAAAGLEVLELHYWNSWLTPLLLLQGLLERLAPARSGADESDLHLPPPWLNRALEQLLRTEARISRRLPLPFGSSLFLVARRQS